MIAGMALTAADPSGLWGLLKELFAGGSALTQAVTGANTNALVKAVGTDFSTGEGRRAAHDCLKAKFATSQAADVKKTSIESLRKISALLKAKAPGELPHSRFGCARLVKALRRPRPRVAVYSELAACKSVTLRRRRLLKYQLLWEHEV
ncbi:hypothetical protein [Bradyrhizobium sp. 157]|uniref:hypothetical protein n=1 Tax=Bradyrhizobium sp. 157 TaxID=2782631 RepID=UPI001FF8A3C3|nr:hypothetical protein [Bradyrhizobium sp. 157]